MGCCYYQIGLGGEGVRVSVPMKSFVFRAEQPTGPDLLADRSIRGGSSSSSGDRDLVFVVNPKALTVGLVKNGGSCITQHLHYSLLSLIGSRSQIDVGVIDRENGESHYFVNVEDVHLSAKAGFFSSRYKKFGNLCYVYGALQAFMGHHNQDFKVRVDEGEWEVLSQVTAICIGNAKYFGGGMKMTPNADPRSGSFALHNLL